MSKNAMAGAVTLWGVGPCLIGGAMLLQNGQHANAATAVSMPATATAVRAAASTQAGGEPTVMWYGASSPSSGFSGVLFPSWSDGTVEGKRSYSG
jgi:hypothetical protein